MDHSKQDCSSQSSGNEEDMSDLRRGPWTAEEDFTLINSIALHGEGRWNSLAQSAGLKRTGKSCRLRWLNYLRPDVRRGNITLEEQLLILELHSRWGNRWSKIAQHLPGRTDNEIKNYWRTRVQKHAKQLKCDVNSKQFKDTMRYLWMPRLVERIQAAAIATASTTTVSASFSGATTVTPATSSCNISTNNYHHQLEVPQNHDMGFPSQQLGLIHESEQIINNLANNNHYGGNILLNQGSFTSENSTSTESFSGVQQQVVSPISELSDCYNYPALNQSNNITNNQDYYQVNTDQFSNYGDSLISPMGYFNQGFDNNYQFIDQNNQWNMDISDSLWNVEDAWFLQ